MPPSYNFVSDSPTKGLHAFKLKKHVNFLIISIVASALFSLCLKRFKDQGFSLSKPASL